MSFAQVKSWRGGRAVECGGLEIRYGCKIIVGSNPTLSVEIPSISSFQTHSSLSRVKIYQVVLS
ncbi:MAG: hypothetical protein RLZZ338_621 [Cyanobacteriota bacterium]